MSSSPNSFQDNFDSHEPRQELESPFLNEEYLAEEARTAPTWRTPVPGFQLESPFLQAFEEGWGAIGELEVEDHNEFFDELGGEEFDELEKDFDEEEELFEFQAPVPTRDYWLKDIANARFGNVPQDVLEKIMKEGNLDVNDLTNQVFWQGHPDLKGVKLNKKDRGQKRLRDEWSRILNRQIKPLIWLRGIVELLDKYRGDIPREFLLGWMAVESDGKVKTITKLDERGYFQIHPDEAKDHFRLSEKDFLRLSSDREYSIQMGVKLVQIYRRYLLDRYNLIDSTELLWHLTKARHGLPGDLKSAMDKLVREGEDITWSAVSQKMSATSRGTKVVNNVNEVLRYAALLKPISDLIPLLPVTTPEVSVPPLEEGWGNLGEIEESEDYDEFLDELGEEDFEEEVVWPEIDDFLEDDIETLSNEIPNLNKLSLMDDDFKTEVLDDKIIGFDAGLSNLNIQLSVNNDGSKLPETILINVTVRPPGKREITVTRTLNVPKPGGSLSIGGIILYKLSVPVSDLGTILSPMDKVKEVATVRRIGGTSDVKFIRALGSRWKGRGQAQQADQCGSNINSGSLTDERPDALKLLQSGGVAILEITIPSTSFAIKKFIRNPADVFYYTGHGLGIGSSGGAAPMNCLAIINLNTRCCWATPGEVIPFWKSPMDLDVFIIAGCSVLAVDASTGTVKGDGLEWAKLLKINGGPLIALLGYGDVDENETNKNGSLGPIGGTAPLDRVAGDPIAKEMGKWIKEHPNFNGIIKKWLWINVFHENFMAIGMDKDGFCWRTRRRATSRWETVNKDKLVSHERRKITFVIEKIKM